MESHHHRRPTALSRTVYLSGYLPPESLTLLLTTQYVCVRLTLIDASPYTFPGRRFVKVFGSRQRRLHSVVDGLGKTWVLLFLCRFFLGRGPRPSLVQVPTPNPDLVEVEERMNTFSNKREIEEDIVRRVGFTVRSE